MSKKPAFSQGAPRGLATFLAFASSIACLPSSLSAANVVVELTNATKVTFVGALERWDADGNPRRPVDPKAKIEIPDVDSVAVRIRPGTWSFADLPPGRYDLVILARDRIRIEGFGYPPVREFDPFMDRKDQPDESARQWITENIAKSTYYENKVTPLSFAGNNKQVRVLVQLLRDKPTSFDRQFGEPVATLRHEVWQFENRYGAWSKHQGTRVLDRVLLAKRELRRWTWIWDPQLGDLQAGEKPKTVRYTLPASFAPQKHIGLLPY